MTLATPRTDRDPGSPPSSRTKSAIKLMSPALSSGKQESNVVTCVRFRPLPADQDPVQYQIQQDTQLLITKPGESTAAGARAAELRSYEFSKVWDANASQRDIFDFFWPKVEGNIFGGYNATIMCYGQTGSGKTHTLSEKGLLELLSKEVFKKIAVDADKSCFSCSISFIEIYLDSVYDLLAVTDQQFKKGGAPTGGNKMNFYEGEKYTRVPVTNVLEVLQAIEDGQKYRKTASHDMNTNSSRSHSLFYFHITKQTDDPRQSWSSKLTVVDLAGSERVSKTNAVGEVFQEAVSINQSLSALMDVIRASVKKQVVVYRQNLLTLYLKDSLVNSYFALICCCSGSAYNLDETLCTLNFGSIAKTVQISRVRNKVVAPKVSPRAVVRALELDPECKSIPVSEYDALTQELEFHRTESLRHTDSLRSMYMELDEKNDRVADLEQQVHSLQTALRLKSMENEGTVQALGQTLEEMRLEVGSQNLQFMEEQAKMLQDQERNERFMMEYEKKLHSQIEELQQRIINETRQAASKEKALQDVINSAVQEMKTLEQQIKEERLNAQHQLSKKEGLLVAKDSDLASAKAKASMLEKSMASRSATVRKLQHTLRDRTNQTSRLSDDLGNAKADLQRLDSVRAVETEALYHECEQLKVCNEKMTQAMGGLQQDKAKLIQRLVGLKSGLQVIGQERDELKNLMSEKDEELAAARTDLDGMQETALESARESAMRDRMNKQTAAIQRLLADREKMQKRMEEIATREQQRRSEIAAGEARRSMLEGQISSLVRVIEQKKAQTQALQEQVHKKESELQQMKIGYHKAIGKIHADLGTKQSELNTMKTQFAKFQAERNSEKDQLMMKFHRLARENAVLSEAQANTIQYSHEKDLELLKEKENMQMLLEIKNREVNRLRENSSMHKPTAKAPSLQESIVRDLRESVRNKEAEVRTKEMQLSKFKDAWIEERRNKQAEVQTKEMELSKIKHEWNEERERIEDRYASNLKVAAIRHKNTMDRVVEMVVEKKDKHIQDIEQKLQAMEAMHQASLEDLVKERNYCKSRVENYAQVCAAEESGSEMFIHDLMQMDVSADNISEMDGADLSSLQNFNKEESPQATTNVVVDWVGTMSESTKAKKKRKKVGTKKAASGNQDPAKKSVKKKKSKSKVDKTKTDSSINMIQWQKEKEKQALKQSIQLSMKKQQEMKLAIGATQSQIDSLRSGLTARTKKTEGMQKQLNQIERVKNQLAKEKKKTEEKLNMIVVKGSNDTKKLESELANVKKNNEILHKRVLETQKQKTWLQTIFNRALRQTSLGQYPPSVVNAALDEAYIRERDEILAKKLRLRQDPLPSKSKITSTPVLFESFRPATWRSKSLCTVGKRTAAQGPKSRSRSQTLRDSHAGDETRCSLGTETPFTKAVTMRDTLSTTRPAELITPRNRIDERPGLTLSDLEDSSDSESESDCPRAGSSPDTAWIKRSSVVSL